MINYDFLKSCENCPNFEATSELENETFSFEKGRIYQYVVTCVNIDKCRELLKHLQKEE